MQQVHAKKEMKTWSIWSGHSLAASSSDTTASLNVEDVQKVILLAQTTTSCDITVEVSIDDTNWFDLTDESGTKVSFTVASTTKAIPIPIFASYVRFTVSETSAAASTVDLDLIGQW